MATNVRASCVCRPAEERDVEHRRQVGVVECQFGAESGGESAGAETLLERHARGQVGRQRQRGEDLRDPCPGHAGRVERASVQDTRSAP
jgi:hypothetical protein